jgi:NADH-quinone oxidoreductase subunit N
MGVVVLSNEGIAAVDLFRDLSLHEPRRVLHRDDRREQDREQHRRVSRPRHASPLVGVSFTIFLLSLTGIPPTAGRRASWHLFAALINGKWFWLAVVGALNSVLSLYYYVRILRNMFLREAEGAPKEIRFSRTQIAILLVLVVPTLLLGIYFAPLVEYAQASVTMFLGK